MDGRNCTGRRISLLNDDVPIVSRKSACTAASKHSQSLSSVSSSSSPRLPSFSHSRASSSRASTPCLSPRTPPLIRSSSADSTDMDMPSPITPEYAGDSYDSLPSLSSQSSSQLFSQTSSAYFVQPSKDVIPTYPPIPSLSIPLPYPQQVPQQLNASLSYTPASQNPPASFAQRPTKSHAATSVQTQRPQQSRHQPDLDSRSQHGTRTKKGQHPCPLAKQYNCSDTFTTSGHASRHAKKHTGEKSAVCPDCGKDFTRKDNMEQHRKTHLNGRNTHKSRLSTDASSKAARSQTKRPKAAPLQSGLSEPLSASPVSMLQQQLPDFIAPSHDLTAATPIYPDPPGCAVYTGGAPIEAGLSPSALHTLASAASVEGRGYLNGTGY